MGQILQLDQMDQRIDRQWLCSIGHPKGCSEEKIHLTSMSEVIAILHISIQLWKKGNFLIPQKPPRCTKDGLGPECWWALGIFKMFYNTRKCWASLLSVLKCSGSVANAICWSHQGHIIAAFVAFVSWRWTTTVRHMARLLDHTITDPEIIRYIDMQLRIA